MDTLCLKLWEGLLTETIDGHFMHKTVKGAAKINYW
jgi:hypothetical protein